MQNSQPTGVSTTTTTEKSQELSILMQRVLGTDNAPEFTKEQVDELLSQKREVNKYRHDDKKQESFDNKFFLAIVLSFILLFSYLVIEKKPELFGEVLSFLAGLFGGGLGGYGLSSRNK